jgi:N utilization substance protein A
MSDSLMTLEGMTPELAEKLMKNGIVTVEDLAEQSIDDLLDISDLTEEKAGAFIMKAREPWFNEKE